MSKSRADSGLGANANVSHERFKSTNGSRLSTSSMSLSSTPAFQPSFLPASFATSSPTLGIGQNSFATSSSNLSLGSTSFAHSSPSLSLGPTPFASSSPSFRLGPTSFASSSPNLSLGPTSFASSSPSLDFRQPTFAASQGLSSGRNTRHPLSAMPPTPQLGSFSPLPPALHLASTSVSFELSAFPSSKSLTQRFADGFSRRFIEPSFTDNLHAVGRAAMNIVAPPIRLITDAQILIASTNPLGVNLLVADEFGASGLHITAQALRDHPGLIEEAKKRMQERVQTGIKVANFFRDIGIVNDHSFTMVSAFTGKPNPFATLRAEAMGNNAKRLEIVSAATKWFTMEARLPQILEVSLTVSAPYAGYKVVQVTNNLQRFNRFTTPPLFKNRYPHLTVHPEAGSLMIYEPADLINSREVIKGIFLVTEDGNLTLASRNISDYGYNHGSLANGQKAVFGGEFAVWGDGVFFNNKTDHFRTYGKAGIEIATNKFKDAGFRVAQFDRHIPNWFPDDLAKVTYTLLCDNPNTTLKSTINTLKRQPRFFGLLFEDVNNKVVVSNVHTYLTNRLPPQPKSWPMRLFDKLRREEPHVTQELATLLKEPAWLPGTGGSARAWTITQRIKSAKLPTQGSIRYVPPQGYDASYPLPRGRQHGFIDRFGNEWTKGPSRTANEPFEWDVQLSPDGAKQLQSISKNHENGWIVNISMKGRITH